MKIKSLFRNSFFSLLSQVVLLIFGFLSQRAMNLYMGSELVGMNGIISNVISILSVTELGISTAIVYHLYSALARNDEDEIAALMNLYRKAYYLFAAVILAIGAPLTPFIHLFMKNDTYSLGYIRILYLLWLLRSVASYPLAYKRSLLIADQKEYIVSVVTMLANVFNYSAVILFVMLTGRYLPALGLSIAAEVGLNLWVSQYVDRKYPFLKKKRKETPPREIVDKILSDLKNVFASKLSLNLLNCTDNLIISGFISVVTVGLFSNYCLVTRSISNIVRALSKSIQPTIGHLFVEDDKEKDCNALRQVTFLFFCIMSIAACGLYALIDPFVCDIWLGESFVLERPVVLMAIITFFVQGMGFPLEIVMGVSGLFRQERNLSIITAVVNLVVSLALAVPLGVTGVLLGTLLSYSIQIVYRIVVFFRIYAGASCRRYVLDFVEYGVLAAIQMMAASLVTGVLYHRSLGTFVLSGVACIIISVGINAVVFCKSWKMKSIARLVQSLRR